MNMVNTHELNEGDVLSHQGMVLTLANRRICRGWTTDLVGIAATEIVMFDGIVTNLEEVRAMGLVPMHMLDMNDDDDRIWKVQGNHLALWDRIKENS